jgi:hypothetical protein
MLRINNLPKNSESFSLLADDILEFHAARLLLIFNICSKNGKFDGLTKMAKMDFFIRYPQFFNTVCKELDSQERSDQQLIESKMIRFHYGPWDHRYYQLLAYLKACELVIFEKDGKKLIIQLTELGNKKATQLIEAKENSKLVQQINRVNSVLGNKSGSQLKKLVYSTFSTEVGDLNLGEVIK